MTRSRALAALAGGLGLVVGVIGGSVVAAVVLVALGLPSTGRADDGQVATTLPAVPRPTQLVVGLRLSDPRLQAGVVKDGEVVLARGLEVEVAREVARRLRMRTVRFVNLDSFTRIPAGPGAKWQVAVTTVRPTRRLGVSGAALSKVYLPTGPVVVQRRGQRPVRSAAELRPMRLCAARGTGAARSLRTVAGSARPPVLAPSSARLFQLVQTGVCDAALVDAVDVSAFVAGRRGLVGAIAARLDVGEGLAVAVAADSGLGVDEVSRALRRLRADGTLGRLSRAWLRIDPWTLRALR